MLWYGVTSSGKTTQIEELVRWVRDTLGKDKVVRLATVSGGGWLPIQGIVNNGQVKAAWIKSRRNPLLTARRICQGYWPADPADPNSKLLQIKEQPDFANVGALVIEDITEMLRWIVSYELREEAKSAKEGTDRDGNPKWILSKKFASENPGVIFKENDGQGDEEVFAMMSRAHYGSAQQVGADLIAESKNIPVPYLVWTGLEDEGKDAHKRACYGVDMPGTALAGVTPSWFDCTLRFAVYPDKGKPSIRAMHLSLHFEGNDPTPYIANARYNWKRPIKSPLVSRWDEKTQQMVGDCSIYRFFELMHQSHLTPTKEN